jgi:hypothetical protein
LFEIGEKGREIAQKAEEAFVIFNNHYHGQAFVNALEVKGKLGEKVPTLPKRLLRRYPQLQELQEQKRVKLLNSLQRQLATTLLKSLSRSSSSFLSGMFYPRSHVP